LCGLYPIGLDSTLSGHYLAKPMAEWGGGAQPAEQWQTLDKELLSWLYMLDEQRLHWIEKAQNIAGAAAQAFQALGLQGELELFGSAVNGFGNCTSDVDLVFVRGPQAPAPREVLMQISGFLQKQEACWNLTHILQGKAPCLKLTDISGIEVDVVVDHMLGRRNTLLLAAYSRADTEYCMSHHDVTRAEAVVRIIKEWVRRSGLVGTVDGMLSSYAYTLLIVYFLQFRRVLPNLQKLGYQAGMSVIADNVETCFADVPAGWCSRSDLSVGQLVWDFFNFYAEVFDWHKQAVSIRLANPEPYIISRAEVTSNMRFAWYIEDPFDLNHNLAQMTTESGRDRILMAFRAANTNMFHHGSWSKLVPDDVDRPYQLLFLKIRVHDAQLDQLPQDLFEIFSQFKMRRLFVSKTRSRLTECFAQFESWEDLRWAQSMNEHTIPSSGQQLALYVSLGYGLMDELQKFHAYPPWPAGTPAMNIYNELALDFPKLPFSIPEVPHTDQGPQIGSAQMNPWASEFVPGMSFGTQML